MCRFDPELTEQLSEKTGFLPMFMKGKELKGYCYVAPDGYKNRKDFEFWISLCLDFNDEAKSSKRDRKKNSRYGSAIFWSCQAVMQVAAVSAALDGRMEMY